MDGNLRMTRGILGRLGSKAVSSRRIIVGLKSDTCSRQVLLRLLQLVVARGDTVLAVHVQQHQDDTFDANTFHIYEDICKSKQVDFEVKICSGSCYIAELAHQVRVTFATILAVGCSSSCPEGMTVAKCLKALPPTCKLLIMDSGGRVLLQQMGTSQQGSSSTVCRTFMSSLSESSSIAPHLSRPQVRKSWSMPSSSTPSTSEQSGSKNSIFTAKNLKPRDLSPILFQRSVMVEPRGCDRCFTYEELNHATESFGADMLVGEGANSRLYKGVLENGQAATVKVLRGSRHAEEVFLQEVEILSGLKHENIVEILGYCNCNEMCAVAYSLCDSSLKQKLNQLKWSERMQVALGVAKALEYLHSCHPPIIHTDINSSIILLQEDGRPLLSDFGAAVFHLSSANRSSTYRRQAQIVETFRYLAPEYIMYGKVDEKVDVYAYGIVLLELITGKEASRTNQASLILWARSLLTCGVYERLIDPSLNEDYNDDEMKAMMIVARLCLLHSSSRRPTMKTILQFLVEPNYVLDIQKRGTDLLVQVELENESDFSRLPK